VDPQEYLEQASKRYPEKIKKPYDEQIQMANTLFESMKMSYVVQVAQGPTGMGKTLVELAVARSLNDLDKRVLIAAPTHNHITDNLLQEARLIFDQAPPVMFGLSHERFDDTRTHCPRGLDTCNMPGSKECEPYQDSCKIAEMHFKCRAANTVFTTHAYIVSKPSFINEFAVLFVDESHGLPNVIRGASQKTLPLQSFQRLLNREKNPEVLSALKDAKEKFDRAVQFSAKSKSSPPPILAQQTLETIKRAARYAPEGSDLSQWLFLDQAKFSSDGSLVATRYRKKPNWNETLSVGLISATVEEPRAHARDCGFESLVLRPKAQYDTETFMRRFERRPIFGLIDGPRLAKGDMENYPLFRNEANGIIVKLVRLLDEVTLILCQNRQDSQSIEAAIREVPDIYRRLSVLPDEEDSSNVESYEEFIKKEIGKGKKVIIATASSKLWEGANVPDLRYLIIDSLPYRRPDPEEKEGTGARAAQSWKNMRRFMLSKVQQGVGRLVRSDDDWGVAVIIDERMYTNRAQFFKELPRYITSPQIFRWVTTDKMESEITIMASQLKAGKNGRKDRSIKDFL